MNQPTHTFNLVFLTVAALTLLSGILACWLAAHPLLSPHQTQLFEMATTTWKIGMGVIFGLLQPNHP